MSNGHDIRDQSPLLGGWLSQISYLPGNNREIYIADQLAAFDVANLTLKL